MFSLSNLGFLVLACGLLGWPISGLIDRRKGSGSLLSYILGAFIALVIILAGRLLLIELNIL